MARRSTATAACIVLFTSLALVRPAFAERVTALHADLDLSTDGSLRVRERIDVDYGLAWRYGIARDLALAVSDDRVSGRRLIEVVSVEDLAGRAIPFRVERRGPLLRVDIGDRRAPRTGRMSYVLEYTVRGAVRTFGGADELYWDVTGSEWFLPLDEASASVAIPQVSSSDLRWECFVAPAVAAATNGVGGPPCETRPVAGRLEFAVTGLRASDGLALAVSFPKGVVAADLGRRDLLRRATVWVRPWMALPLGLALALVIVALRRRGAPGATGRAVAGYLPPAGLRPAQAGAIWRGHVALEDTFATLLDLARRGAVVFEERESDHRLFLADRDFDIIRVHHSHVGLMPYEVVLLDTLFEMSDRLAVSGLRAGLPVPFDAVDEAVYTSLATDVRAFTASPRVFRAAWRMGAWALAVGALIALFFNAPGLGTGLLASACVMLAAGRWMPARTRYGWGLRAELADMRAMLLRADVGRLRAAGHLTPERFADVLPFALVLGVGDAWCSAFASAVAPPPLWLRGSTGDPSKLATAIARIGRLRRAFFGALRWTADRTAPTHVGTKAAGVTTALVISLVFSASADAAHVDVFRSDITVGRGGWVHVSETWVIDFEGGQRLFVDRDLPARLDDRGQGRRLAVRSLVAGGEGGVVIPVHARRDGDVVRVRLGDGREPFRGVRRFRLEYDLGGAATLTTTGEELFVPVISHGWRVGVQEASAAVRFPDNPESARASCLVGTEVNASPACTTSAEGSDLHVAVNRPLEAGERFEVMVWVPVGTIEDLPLLRRAFDTTVAVFGPFALLPLLAWLILGPMMLRGRRERAQWSDATAPPARLGPAEVGTAWRASVQPLDLAATVVDLARRGHLTLRPIPSSDVTDLSIDDWEVIHRDGGDALRKYEVVALVALLDGAPRRRLSEARQRLRARFGEFRVEVLRALRSHGRAFVSDPQRFASWLRVGAILAALSALVAALFGERDLAMALLLTAATVELARRTAPVRTAHGARVRAEIDGLRRFFAGADAETLVERGLATRAAFDELLPYAVVTSTGDAWADACAAAIAAESTPYLHLDAQRDVGDDVAAIGAFIDAIEAALEACASPAKTL